MALPCLPTTSVASHTLSILDFSVLFMSESCRGAVTCIPLTFVETSKPTGLETLENNANLAAPTCR